MINQEFLFWLCSIKLTFRNNSLFSNRSLCSFSSLRIKKNCRKQIFHTLTNHCSNVCMFLRDDLKLSFILHYVCKLHFITFFLRYNDVLFGAPLWFSSILLWWWWLWYLKKIMKVKFVILWYHVIKIWVNGNKYLKQF